MGRGPYWPDTRTPLLLAPTLDAVSGRSYSQASQTPGALGGRRSVMRWYTADGIPRMEPTVAGGWWRLIAATARVRISPFGGAVSIDIKVDGPDHPAVESVFEFEQALSIADGEYEATGGVLKQPRPYPIPYNTFHRIYPPGDLFFVFNSSLSGVSAQDLTVELHYIVRPVSQ